MEFFVFIEDEVSDCILFRVTPTETIPTFKEIVDKSFEIFKSYNDQLDPTKYKLYYDDYTFPFVSREYIEITDLSQNLFSLGRMKVDFYLSPKKEPGIFQFEEEEAANKFENEIKQEFDETINQGNNALANMDVSAVKNCIIKAKSLIPNSPLSLHLHIKLLLKLKQYKLAINETNAACRIYPGDRECLRLLAKAHQKVGLHKEAIEYFRRLILLSDKNKCSFDEINYSIAKSLFAMELYSQAQSLIQSIIDSNPKHLKAIILMGKILVKQGNLIDAIHLVFKNFLVEPDHKATRKFIGENVVNDKQIEILKAELGDGIFNPNVLFYVGDILNEFGSSYASFYFYNLSFSLAPESPAIAVGCIKSGIENIIEQKKIFELFNSFLPNILKRNDELKNLVKDFDIENLTSDFETTEVIHSKQYENLPKGTINCQYKFEQYDIIWIFILLEVYLFKHGYIKDAIIISKNIQEITKQYLFEKTILSNEIRYHYYISSLLLTIERPLLKIKRIFLLGDENSAYLAWKTISFHQENYLLTPMIVDNLSINDLISTKVTTSRNGFYKYLKMIPTSSMVLFSVSKIEYVEALINNQINLLLKEIQNIITDMNLTTFWILPIITGNYKITKKVNEILSNEISLLKDKVPGMKFINALDKLIDENLRFKEEYTFDCIYFKPSVIPIIEDCLNEN